MLMTNVVQIRTLFNSIQLGITVYEKKYRSSSEVRSLVFVRVVDVSVFTCTNFTFLYGFSDESSTEFEKSTDF